jgi:hypothetical protein
MNRDVFWKLVAEARNIAGDDDNRFLKAMLDYTDSILDGGN